MEIHGVKKKINPLETAIRKRGAVFAGDMKGFGSFESRVAHTPDVQWSTVKPHLLPRYLALECRAAEPCEHAGMAEEPTPWSCALSQWLQRLTGSSTWSFHGATGVCLLWDSCAVFQWVRSVQSLRKDKWRRWCILSWEIGIHPEKKRPWNISLRSFPRCTKPARRKWNTRL